MNKLKDSSVTKQARKSRRNKKDKKMVNVFGRELANEKMENSGDRKGGIREKKGVWILEYLNLKLNRIIDF